MRSLSPGTLVTSQGGGLQLNARLRAVAERSPWGHGDTKAPVLWEPSPRPSCPLSSRSGEHAVSRKAAHAHLEEGQVCTDVSALVGGQVPTQALSHPPSSARQGEMRWKSSRTRRTASKLLKTKNQIVVASSWFEEARMNVSW